MLTATIGIENSVITPEIVNLSPVLYSDLSKSTAMLSAKPSEINTERPNATTSNSPILVPSTYVKSQICI